MATVAGCDGYTSALVGYTREPCGYTFARIGYSNGYTTRAETTAETKKPPEIRGFSSSGGEARSPDLTIMSRALSFLQPGKSAQIRGI